MLNLNAFFFINTDYVTAASFDKCPVALGPGFPDNVLWFYKNGSMKVENHYYHYTICYFRH